MAINFEVKDLGGFLSKLPYKRLLIFITLFSGFLLFASDDLLEKMFLLKIRNTLGEWLGVIFLGAGIGFLVCLFSWMFRNWSIFRKYTGRQAQRKFDMLSEEAGNIILEMYFSPSHSTKLFYSSASATLLERQEFISRSTISDGGFEFEYFLQPWVVRYLDKNIPKYMKELQSTEEET